MGGGGGQLSACGVWERKGCMWDGGMCGGRQGGKVLVEEAGCVSVFGGGVSDGHSVHARSVGMHQDSLYTCPACEAQHPSVLEHPSHPHAFAPRPPLATLL
eukprot:365736-Chlamydomonas_euryale.AAC.14